MTRLKTFFLLALVCLAGHQAFSQCQVLVWSDEFEGTGAPNSAFWSYDLGAGGWGNNEVQTYTSSLTNVRQENGKLIIDAIKSGGNWTSGRIKTQGKKTFTYGKIEFRAKLPTGVGTWPALWMLGQSIGTVGWPACGEIDVMEHVGKNQNVVQAALHTPSSNGNTINKGSTTIPTASTEFHNYSVSWNSTRIAFYVDDVLYYTYNPAVKNASTWPFNADQFIIMNIAMGGNFGGPTIDPALTAARMEVEYVRVYEERSSPLISGPQFVYENQSGLTYSAPEYGAGVDYAWSVPPGATILSGQGTNEITVDWGSADGILELDLTGDTGCAINSVSINVTTIVEPTGDKYLAHSFSTNQLTGWTTNGAAAVTLQNVSNKLSVNYNLTELKYVQFELPKAVDVQHYSIVKLPITIPASSPDIPDLIMTFRDGDGKETITTSFEVNASVKDDLVRLYTYDFDGRWNQNTPEVNPNFIKFVRIYMLPGQGSFTLGDLYFYNNQNAPVVPANLAASVDVNQVTLSWEDTGNATSFHLYRSDTENGIYTRERSNIQTSENPYVIIPDKSINYYKVSGVNALGESALSEPVEAIAVITSSEDELQGVTLYPNPTNGVFTIESPDGRINRIDIFDLNGRKIAFTSREQNTQVSVALDHAPSGMYFLRLSGKNSSRIYKLLVE